MRNARYAVALTFDDNTSKTVRHLAQQLDLAPLTIESTAVPPHVTLAVCAGVDLSAVEEILSRTATNALESTLASVGIFPTPEPVVYLGVAPSPQLVALQAAIVERVREIGGEVEPYWIPGQWIPHCTLATGLPLEVIPGVIERLVHEFVPASGVLTRVNVVEVESGRLCYAAELHTGHT